MSDSEPIAYLRINEMAGSTPHELRKLAQRARARRDQGNHSRLARPLDQFGPHGRSAGRQPARSRYDRAGADEPGRDGLPGRRRCNLSADGRSRCSWTSYTSGAAEWLAAAIQDNQRGIVIGAPTSSARVNPGYAVVTSLVRVGNSDWSVSLATGILERGDGRPISAFDRSIPTMIREPRARPPECIPTT